MKIFRSIEEVNRYFDELNKFNGNVKNVVCFDNTNFEDKLCVGKEYDVLMNVNGLFVIKAEDGKTYWFKKNRFMFTMEEKSMNKKEVLRIEYAKAFDTWYGRVAYQDEDVLKRMAFEDKKIGVLATYMPGYEKETKTLLIRGIHVGGDNTIFEIGSDADKKIVEEKVANINEKYGIRRKSWKEMIDECEEVPFKVGKKNYYLFLSHHSNNVRVIFEEYGEDYKKYISKEDAERIVKECAENNRG